MPNRIAAKPMLDALPGLMRQGRRVASDGIGAESMTTLAVIAGGAGRRMGGPKHALRINGTPILRFILERLCWQGPTMLVVQANGGRVDGQERVNQVVADSVGGEGPLRGILTALECCRTERLIVVPIDMPGLSAVHLSWLLERGVETGATRLLLRRAVNGRPFIEPFPAFFRTGGAGEIRGFLAAGGRALRELAGLPGTHVVDAPTWWETQTWVNLNTPVDAAPLDAQFEHLDPVIHQKGVDA